MLSSRTLSCFKVIGLMVIGLLVFETSAQEKAASVKASRRAPLPYYFGKLAVDETQREQLYRINDSYETKLEALRLEMKNLLSQRDSEMEAALTPGQKLRLQELKAAAVKEKAQGKQPAEKPAADSKE